MSDARRIDRDNRGQSVERRIAALAEPARDRTQTANGPNSIVVHMSAARTRCADALPTAQSDPMPTAINLRFRPGRSDTGPGAALLAAFAAEMGTLYVPRFEAGSPSATPAELTPPGGAFLVGYLESQPVACGGLKRLEPQVAEIKRMYVAPAARSRGVARTLLATLEEATRELGYTVTRLDTGAAQPHAHSLYTSAGYRPIPDYDANPYAAWWGEKTL
jgi:GNAT superfamily N-acetyltransferase